MKGVKIAQTSPIPLCLCIALCNGSRYPSNGFVLEELCNKAVLRRIYEINTPGCQQNDFSLFP